MSRSWWFLLTLKAVGVRPASGACEQDRRGLALSEWANVHVRRYRCGVRSGLRAVATYCAVVEGSVVLSPYLAQALVPSSV